MIIFLTSRCESHFFLVFLKDLQLTSPHIIIINIFINERLTFFDTLFVIDSLPRNCQKDSCKNERFLFVCLSKKIRKNEVHFKKPCIPVCERKRTKLISFHSNGVESAHCLGLVEKCLRYDLRISHTWTDKKKKSRKSNFSFFIGWCSGSAHWKLNLAVIPTSD